MKLTDPQQFAQALAEGARKHMENQGGDGVVEVRGKASQFAALAMLLEAPNHWIPVSERKPPESVPVLTKGAGPHPEVLIWWHRMGDAGKGGDFGRVTVGKRTTNIHHVPGVTHWMPIVGWDRT